MALWITRPEMQNKILDYFSSVDCMSLRIMGERQKVQESCKNWEKLTIEEQEARIDDWIVPIETRNCYASKATDVDVFPALRVDTGQKIEEMHVLTERNEITTSWKDEHSNPFTIESKSQMDLRLPDRDGVMKSRRKKSNTSVGSESQNGGVMNTKELPDLLGNLNGGFQADAQTVTDDPNAYFDVDFSNNGAFKTESYDLSSDQPVTINGFQILSNEPDWSETNDAPTFTQFSMEDKKGGTEIKNGRTNGGSDFKKSEKPMVTRDFAFPSDRQEDVCGSHFSDPVFEMSRGKEISGKHKQKKKAKKAEEAMPEPSGGFQAPVSKQKKGHRKKSSGGNSTTSNQLNPRLSLTLDGAIKNLEVCVELNRQQKLSPTLTRPPEQAALVDGSRELDFDNIFPDKDSQEDSPLLSPLDLKGGSSPDVQRTGFDFLDNW